MSPFAGYADWDSCLRANADKGDAAAYCGAIKRTVEGAGPRAGHVEKGNGLGADGAWAWCRALLVKGAAVVGEEAIVGQRLRLARAGGDVCVWDAAAGGDVSREHPAAREAARLLKANTVLEVLDAGDGRYLATDLLVASGRDVTERPAHERRQLLLAQMATMGPGTLRLAKQRPVRSHAELALVLKWAATQAGSEGLLLKAVDAVYAEGETAAWYLLKGEWAEGKHPREPKGAEGGGEDEASDSLRFLKADAPLRQVTGVIFEPDVEDTQGDVIDAAEIVKACHQFLKDYRAGRTRLRLSHAQDLGDEDAVLVENWVAPGDFTLGAEPVRKGTWLQTWQVLRDDLWEAVESGKLTGFSFGGVGIRALAKAFEEGKHPRHPEGHKGEGGRFAPAGGEGGSGDGADEADEPGKAIARAAVRVADARERMARTKGAPGARIRQDLDRALTALDDGDVNGAVRALDAALEDFPPGAAGDSALEARTLLAPHRRGRER